MCFASSWQRSFHCKARYESFFSNALGLVHQWQSLRKAALFIIREYTADFCKKKKRQKKSTNVSNLYASIGLLCFISLKWWELSSSYYENIHLGKLWEFFQDAMHPAEGSANDPLTRGRFILFWELPTGFIIKFHTKVFTQEELKNFKGNYLISWVQSWKFTWWCD